MIQTLHSHRVPRLVAYVLAAMTLLPVLAGCGNSGAGSGGSSGGTTAPAPVAPAPMSAQAPPPMSATPAAKPGMSKGEKVVIVLAGAALLYYLYKKHQAAQQAQGTAMAGKQPQLYRSSNGGVYYRNPANPQQVTWLTVPSQPVSVPANQVQQYAPDYQQYQGQAPPAVPSGAATQSFSAYNNGG